MDEGSPAPFIDTISVTQSEGLELEIFRLEGVKAEITKGMQTCSCLSGVERWEESALG